MYACGNSSSYRMNKVYASGRRDANYPPIPPEATRKITLVPESIGSSIPDQDLVSILTDPCCIDTYFLMPEVGWVRLATSISSYQK